MRSEILDYIQTLNLSGFSLTQELPWSSNGQALYLKNPKRIYVDKAQFSLEPLLETLDGIKIAVDTVTVKVYFSNDAKILPPGYDDLITDLKLAKNINSTDGYRSRTCVISTEFQEDNLVTELEFSYTKTT
jgi:hypothetical protein